MSQDNTVNYCYNCKHFKAGMPFDDMPVCKAKYHIDMVLGKVHYYWASEARNGKVFCPLWEVAPPTYWQRFKSWLTSKL